MTKSSPAFGQIVCPCVHILYVNQVRHWVQLTALLDEKHTQCEVFTKRRYGFGSLAGSPNTCGFAFFDVMAGGENLCGAREGEERFETQLKFSQISQLDCEVCSYICAAVFKGVHI